jgi:hypothetical protein
MVIEEPVSNCPGCGRRVNLNTLDRRLPGKRRQALLQDDERRVMTATADEDDGEPELTLAPPVVDEKSHELPPEVIAAIEKAKEAEEPWKTEEPPPPVPATITVGGIMLGTLVVAVCMAVARLSFAWGVAMFMVFLPAYARTIAAVGYFRKRDHELTWREVAEAFGNSAVLGLMALPASAFVFLVVNEIGAAMVTSESTVTPRHVFATLVSVGFAVWVTQRAWPVNER